MKSCLIFSPNFAEKGYRKTRVTGIISSLGIATMTFYRYFPNKRQLFLEVVDAIVADMVEHVEAEISGEEDYVMRMLRRGMAFYNVYSQNSGILQILRGEAVGEDRQLNDLVERIYRRLALVMVQDFEDWKKVGLFPALDPEITAYALLGASELAILRISMDDRYTMMDLLTQGLDFLMAIQSLPSADLAPLRKKYKGVIGNLMKDESQKE
jgi:AcrR family transcriptional regulator